MSTFVVVNTYTHSVTYVTDKMLNSIKNIIRLSGLNPAKLTSEWVGLERGIKRWLETEYLQEIHLEVYNPVTSALIGRWDFEIFYGFTGDGAFWVDTDAIKYHILKAGVWPSTCEYRIVVTNKPGRPVSQDGGRRPSAPQMDSSSKALAQRLMGAVSVRGQVTGGRYPDDFHPRSI